MAGQQISLEAAAAAFERRAGELFRANVLLEARIAELEAEVASLRQQHQDPALAGYTGVSDTP